MGQNETTGRTAHFESLFPFAVPFWGCPILAPRLFCAPRTPAQPWLLQATDQLKKQTQNIGVNEALSGLGGATLGVDFLGVGSCCKKRVPLFGDCTM